MAEKSERRVKMREKEARRRENRRNDPEAYRIYCEQEKERNARRRAKGVELKFKKAEDLTDRQLRARKKKQRQWTRNHRLKMKAKSPQNCISSHINEKTDAEKGSYSIRIVIIAKNHELFLGKKYFLLLIGLTS